MKYLLFIFAILFSLPVMADKYHLEIKRAQRSCELQRSSLLREREGTPACDTVRQLRRQQREYQRDRRYNRAIDLMDRPVIIEHRYEYAPRGSGERGGGYYWNNAVRQYCIHDDDGYVLECD